MKRIALIGRGRWGKKIIKTLKGIRGVKLVFVGGRSHLSDLNIAEIDAAIIASPGSTHVEIALPLVKKGIPVFIEKPLALSVADTKKFERAAKSKNTKVFVGHLHLYNPAYLKAKAEVQKLGKIQSIVCEGMSDGPVRDDMSVLWDWGTHDVYVVLDLLGKMPTSVQAWGKSSRKGKPKIHDFTMSMLHFPGNVDALIVNSWLSPEKIKRVTITCAKGSVMFEDSAKKKVAVHKGLNTDNPTTQYPPYAKQLALDAELRAFIAMLSSSKKPPSNLQNGMNTVVVLEKAEKSMASKGKSVKI